MGFIKWLFGGEVNQKYIQKQNNKQIERNHKKIQYLKEINNVMARLWNDAINKGCDFPEAYEWFSERWTMKDMAYVDQNADVMQYFFSINPDLLPDEYYSMVWGENGPKSREIAQKLSEKEKKQEELNKIYKINDLEFRLKKIDMEERILKNQIGEVNFQELEKRFSEAFNEKYNANQFKIDCDNEFAFLQIEILKKEYIIEKCKKQMEINNNCDLSSSSSKNCLINEKGA